MEQRNWKRNFEDSELKGDLRLIVKHSVDNEMRGEKSFQLLTLPSDTLMFETSLTEQHKDKISIVGVEREKDVFRRASKIIQDRDLNVELHNCEDSEYLKFNDREFNGMWLDYCGPFSSGKRDVMFQIVAGDHVKLSKKHSPFIALTLQDGMDLELCHEYEGIAKKIGIDQDVENPMYLNRIHAIPHILNAEANKYGNTFEVKKVYRYLDQIRTKKACPMIMYMCQLRKGIYRQNLKKMNLMRFGAQESGSATIPKETT